MRGPVIMNTDGPVVELKEAEHRQVQDLIIAKASAACDHAGAGAVVEDYVASGTSGGGSGGGQQDVVMEMATNFAGGTMSRRVSFPNDKHLVTGYMEPANPWANGE